MTYINWAGQFTCVEEIFLSGMSQSPSIKLQCPFKTSKLFLNICNIFLSNIATQPSSHSYPIGTRDGFFNCGRIWTFEANDVMDG